MKKLNSAVFEHSKTASVYISTCDSDPSTVTEVLSAMEKETCGKKHVKEINNK